jgi:hypothetical protein
VAHAQSIQGNSQRPCVENRSPRKLGIEKKRCGKDRAQSRHEAFLPKASKNLKDPIAWARGRQAREKYIGAALNVS